ncbi:hypothetical protein A9200_00445 [Maribacter hydrothermalis]|uniref:Uncharacterized protein n=2 Tax=Maribacter hydrothermalis TaxID=1836467 RepID=A0A1B7ZEE0_9FLAO|nr:hypothetical protein BTR34_08800 [Maribacter hydrothermalis]OBR41894.1 hypothetical protein A9200_00445 [Maribacter hydrothermalis]
MKNKFMLLTVVIAFICNSCSIDDDGANFHFTALEIIDADVPESFNLNETYVISVRYLKPDRCTYYEGFDVIKDSLTVRNVVAIGSVRTDLNCTEEITEQTASFNFKVIYADPYTFKFYTGENSDGDPEYLEVVVPVNKS